MIDEEVIGAAVEVLADLPREPPSGAEQPRIDRTRLALRLAVRRSSRLMPGLW